MLPTITHLQAAIMSILGHDPVLGSDIRSELTRRGYAQDLQGPAFYMAMARMERDGLITGDYQMRTSGVVQRRARVYSMTENGIRKYINVKDFYKNL